MSAKNLSSRHFEPPTVYVVARRSRSGVWVLFMPKCPYCNGQHQHGAGAGEKPNLGHRVADCTVWARGYILAEVAQ